MRLNVVNVRPIWSRTRDSQPSGRRSSVRSVYMSFKRPPKIVNSVDALITKTDKNDRNGTLGKRKRDNAHLDEPNILCPKS